MECTRLKQILSEYIDGTLDTQTATAIKEHLKNCRVCNQEYISMRALINELQSLDSLDAPGDLLKKIHERIEAQSWFDRIRNLLFFPAHIKVPIELSALAATAIIVFFVFNMIQTEEQSTKILSRNGKTKVAMKQEVGYKEPAINRSIFNETGIQHRREPIQLVLLLASQKKDKPIPSENIISVVSDTGPGKEDTTDLGLMSPPLPLPLNGRDLGEGEEEKFPYDQDSVISDINDIVSKIEGRLLSKKYKNGDNYHQHITLEIPAVNYGQFLEKTGQIGSFQTPYPAMIEEEHQGKVLLKIYIVPPK